MKSQAIARSESPRTRRASGSGVTRAAPSSSTWASIDVMPGRLFDLAVVLEDFLPVHDERIEGFLRAALVGDHIIVGSLLHGKQQLRVRRLRPEVDHHVHRLEELAGEGRALQEARLL